MRLSHIDRISPQRINNLKVLLEHIRVLVIFAGDVLLYCCRELNVVRFTEWEEEDITGWVRMLANISATIDKNSY